MLKGAQLTVTADPDADGATETGVFDLKRQVRIEAGVQTLDLIGPRGQQAASLINKTGVADIAGSGGFSLSGGAAIETYTINFQDFGGSSGRWGDGSATAALDAQGEGPLRQLSVLQAYLRSGAFDSTNPISLALFEFDGTTYETIDCKLVDPTLTFNVAEQTSTFDGSITLRRIGDIADVVNGASGQQNNK
jgi:hypothetical protein